MRIRRDRSVLLALLLTGCASRAGEEYFPKDRQGAQMEYRLEYTTLGGVQTGRMVSRVEGDTAISGHTYTRSVIAFSGVPGLGQVIGYSRRDRSGIHGISATSGWREYLFIPFPVTPGDSWTVQTGDSRATYTAEGRERVALLGETFDDCLKVTSTGQGNGHDVLSTSWFARGVGLVRMTWVTRGITFDVTLDRRE